MPVQLLVLLIVAICCVSYFLRRSQDVAHPLVVVSAYHIVIFALPGVFQSVFELRLWSDPDSWSQSETILLSGYGAILAGYFLSKHVREVELTRLSFSYSSKAPSFLALAVISVAFQLYLLMLFGPRRLHGSLPADFMGGMGVINLLGSFSFPLILLAWAQSGNKHRNTIATLVVIYMSYKLLIVSRFTATLVEGFALYYYYLRSRGRRVPVLPLAVLGIPVLMGLFVLKIYFSADGYGGFDIARFNVFLIESLGRFEPLAAIVGGENTRLYGASLVKWIPFSYYLPVIGKIAQTVNWLPLQIAGLPEAATTWMVFTFWGEVFVNFGLSGVVIYGLLFGAGVRILGNWLQALQLNQNLGGARVLDLAVYVIMWRTFLHTWADTMIPATILLLPLLLLHVRICYQENEVLQND